jgi:hypothetical protein
MNIFQGGLMKRSFGVRKTASLSVSLYKQLNMYALAASAAGLGMSALASPAEAKIVYTTAHVPIVGRVTLDLNHDGIADFAIQQGARGQSYWIDVHSLRQNRVWGRVGGGIIGYASALTAGVLVGPNRTKFQMGSVCSRYFPPFGPCKFMVDCNNGSTRFAPWANRTSGYLGLEFRIKGKIHYGWARLNRKTVQDKLVLTGYAYETIPNKPIIAGQTKGLEQRNKEDFDASDSLTIPSTPQPASLGALAMGAPGLSIWRRESVGATR